MRVPVGRKAVSRARDLRVNATSAERRLWSVLRSRTLVGWKFRRQRPIGHYIVDFACAEARLIIEVDGGQHAENAADAARTRWLESLGWRVIRFWNPDVLKNTDGVAETILHALKERQRTLTPTLARGAGEGDSNEVSRA